MSNYITGLLFSTFTVYDSNTNQYLNVPYYNAYQVSDGQVYNIESALVNLIPNTYGLTRINYPFVDTATNTIQNHQIPMITTLADGKPLHQSVQSVQHNYDANVNADLNQSLQSLLTNTNYFDRYLHDIITGQVFDLGTPQVQQEHVQEPVVEQPMVEPTQEVVEPIVEQPTEEVEETTKQIVAQEETQEEIIEESVQEEIQEETIEQPTEITEEPTQEEALGGTTQEESQELSLEDLVGEQIANEIKEEKEEQVLNHIEPSPEKPVEIKETVNTVYENQASEGKFRKIEFVDRPLNDITEEMVIQNRQDIAEGKTLEFKPRVLLSSKPLVNITKEKLRDLYNDIKDGYTPYDADPEAIREIRLFFGKDENFELKTIFDAFSIDEVTAMLHINILDLSPTGLYEGLYRYLYIYKQYLDLRCTDDYENYTWLLIKLVHFSTQTQKAVVREIDDNSGEDDDEEKEKAVIFVNDLYYESNNLLRRYLTDELLFTDIEDSNGKLLDGMDKLKHICTSKATGRVISMKSTPFNRGIGIENIAILISSNNLTLLSGQNELCPNVLGLLYGDFQKLIKNYVSENTLTEYKLEELPIEDICDKLSYNTVLNYVKEHDSFKKAYGITSFLPISEVCDMCLNIEKIIFPIIDGKKSGKPVALICKDLNSTNQTKRVILPTVGKYLISLDELGVSFSNCKVIVGKAEKDGVVFGAIKNFKDGILSSGATASLIPIKFDETTSIGSIQIDIDRCIEESCTFPKFVQDDEQNILHGYRVLGLYK